MWNNDKNHFLFSFLNEEEKWLFSFRLFCSKTQDFSTLRCIYTRVIVSKKRVPMTTNNNFYLFYLFCTKNAVFSNLRCMYTRVIAGEKRVPMTTNNNFYLFYLLAQKMQNFFKLKMHLHERSIPQKTHNRSTMLSPFALSYQLRSYGICWMNRSGIWSIKSLNCWNIIFF